MKFKLQFPDEHIVFWSGQYDYTVDEQIQTFITPQAKERGFCYHADLIELCRWKSPRIQGHCTKNDPSFVIDVTKTALHTQNEQFRIEVLRLLKGVNWPMASVILHWCHRDPYPIIDFRALWSLGIDPIPKYTFEFWWAYTCACRQIAEHVGVSMRVLDRALWAYSKAKL